MENPAEFVILSGAMITLTKVSCQGCGAALEVDSDTRFTTCRYCRSRVAISHDSVPAARARREEPSAAEVQILRLQRQLDDLDRAWERFLEKTLIPDGNGKFYEPSLSNTLAITWLTLGLGLMFLLFSPFARSPEMALAGFLVALIGGLRWKFRSRESDYEAAKAKYESRHAALMREIGGLKNRS